MEPLPKDKRHPANYRDEIEHAEVVAALSELRKITRRSCRTPTESYRTASP